MVDMVRIVHNDYSKISDRVMWLSSSYVLNFNVDLCINKKTPNGKNKENYHKEFGYTYDGKFNIKITRDFNYYLSIESVRRDNNTKVIIGPNYIYFFKFKLENVIDQWFRQNQVFAKQDGKIFIPTEPQPISVGLDFGNTIEFRPSIQEFNSDQTIGVAVFINQNNDGFFLSINDLLSFSYFISTFNMYESAQLLVNYIGRPENGTNYAESGSNINSTNGPSSSFFIKNKQSGN